MFSTQKRYVINLLIWIAFAISNDFISKAI